MSNWLAVFNLGGGEIILILALILILFGARQLPDMGKGFGEGLEQFWKHRRDHAVDPRSLLRWGADWVNLITFLLLGILAMVILSLFAG